MRPPRYTSNSTMASSGPGAGSTQNVDERVRVWSANIPSLPNPESPYSDTTLPEGTESSLTNSVIEASTKVTTTHLLGPRYCKRSSLT